MPFCINTSFHFVVNWRTTRGSFASIGSHPSPANCADATVEVVAARSRIVFPVLWIGSMWDQISAAKEAAQELHVWDCYQRPFKIVPRHSGFVLCGAMEDVAFLIRRHPPRSASFACIGRHPSLANQMNVTVTVKVGKARSQNCSSRLCYSWGPCETRSLETRSYCDHYKFGTATGDQEIAQCETVNLHGCRYRPAS